MQPGQFSRTAEFMALFRALELVRRTPRRLFRDPFAAAFLGPPLRQVVRWSAMPLAGDLLRRIIDRLWPGARSSGVARTRLIDDWVGDAVAAGASQAVLLGAGFDSRAWRLPVLAGLPVFEVDHPATAAEKFRRIAVARSEKPPVVSVTLDFDRERLSEVLSSAGFDRTRPTLVIWEGVTNYLSAEAVDTMFGWLGSLAVGSRVAFTYVHRAVLSDPASFAGAAKILLAVSSAGEPWTFGFDPAALPAYLQAHGLRLLEDLGADDYRKRYYGRQAERMQGYAFYRAALAAVVPPVDA